MQYCNINTHCAVVDNANYALLTATQKQTLTAAEQCFIVQFLADTLASLTALNNESVVEGEAYVTRLTDALEVMQNLNILYETYEDDTARLTFTIADAGAALCSYDTEYRECIAEQFECECDAAAKTAKQLHTSSADYTTLALRVMYAY